MILCTCETTQYLLSCVWLISLSIVPSCSIHVVTNGRISFFFKGSITFIYMWIYIWHFLIYSFIDRHLGYFHILTIILWWIWECSYLFEIMILFPSDKNTEVELLDHMVVLFLIFWGTFILLSIVTAPIYIPTKSDQGFPFLHTLSNTCYLLSSW